MRAKKPIRCPECQKACVEVGQAIAYPRRIEDPEASRKGRAGYEHRYVCPHCGAEYIHETLSRKTSRVPEGADFNIRLVSEEEVIQVNSPLTLMFWGLPPEKRGIELKADEVRDLQRRACEIRDRLSRDQLSDDVLVWKRFRLKPAERKKLLGRDV